MTNPDKKRPYWLSATKAEARDTGMALVLLCLLGAWFGHRRDFLGAAIILLVLDMSVPAVFKPAAKLWFGLSHVLGTVMSKILLTVVFVMVVTPMGVLRRVLGKDTMQFKRFKKDDGSVFRVRDHRFTTKDIETPY